MGYRKDMTGLRFNKLLVVEAAGKEVQGQMKWLCQCDCGNRSIATGRNLRNGHTQSCGCYRLEKNTKHGHDGEKKSPEYTTWDSMIQRCTNKKSLAYKGYGAQGIKVCERWRTFEFFLEDMGLRPSPEHSLDRFPNMGGDYEPGNCRWATIPEQARNKKSNVWIEYNGEKMVLNDWAKKTGISFPTLRRRIKLGVSIHDALTIIPKKGKKTKLTFQNQESITK